MVQEVNRKQQRTTERDKTRERERERERERDKRNDNSFARELPVLKAGCTIYS